jgi:CheY-like chemotaxis protein
VLLVDDDPLVRRFAEMVLEELDIDLLMASSVDDAIRELRRAPVSALLSDLMLPVRSGLDLLQQLANEPALRGNARLIVMSAGLTRAMQQQLDAFDVWRRLMKPVSVTQLVACVREAISLENVGGEPPSLHAPAVAGQELSVAEWSAIDLNFAGDRAMFLAFRAGSLPQLQLDLEAGDKAIAGRDFTTVCHLAHNLKSLFMLLGRIEAADIARTLENELTDGSPDRAGTLWQALHASLDREVQPAGKESPA